MNLLGGYLLQAESSLGMNFKMTYSLAYLSGQQICRTRRVVVLVLQIPSSMKLDTSELDQILFQRLRRVSIGPWTWVFERKQTLGKSRCSQKENEQTSLLSEKKGPPGGILCWTSSLKAVAMSKSAAGNPRPSIMITAWDPEWSGSSSSHLRDPHLWAIHRAEISRTSGSMMTMLAVPCIGPKEQFTSLHT